MGVIKYRFLKFHSSPKVPHLKVPFLPLTESGPMADIEIEEMGRSGGKCNDGCLRNFHEPVTVCNHSLIVEGRLNHEFIDRYL